MFISNRQSVVLVDMVETDYTSVSYRVITTAGVVTIDWSEATSRNDGYYSASVTLAEGNYIVEWRGSKITGDIYVKEEINVVKDFISDIATILKIENGNWKIENNQMKFYDSGNNLLYTYNLLDQLGNPSDFNVYQRVRV